MIYDWINKAVMYLQSLINNKGIGMLILKELRIVIRIGTIIKLSWVIVYTLIY